MESTFLLKVLIKNLFKKSLIHKSTYALHFKRVYSTVKSDDLRRVNDLKVAFFGTDVFSLKILNGLNNLLDQKKIKEIKVITSATRVENYSKEITKILSDNNGSPIEYQGILDFCIKNNIKYHFWSEIKINKNYMEILKDYDIGLVASFGHLLPASLIEMFPW